MSTTAADLKPGSAEAIAAGCKCPVIDNRHGRGYMGQPDVFVYSSACPYHCASFAATAPAVDTAPAGEGE